MDYRKNIYNKLLETVPTRTKQLQNKIYNKMGSPLSAIISEIFLQHNKKLATLQKIFVKIAGHLSLNKKIKKCKLLKSKN